MNIHPLRLVAALVLVLLAACKCADCAAPAACSKSLSQADREALAANSAAWLKAVRASDWDAVAAGYTDDAMLLPPNQPVVSGRDAIRAWFAAFPPLVFIVSEDLEVGGCCDTAFVRGEYVLLTATAQSGETMEETGKFIEIRRKQADGTWLTLRDIFNADGAPVRSDGLQSLGYLE
ncbi:MAG: DUF4440 domain-containing protein [Planctomycetes bacterium]|nr:DUF4440 domain-containing protein [Planctomycetota bacterium]